MSAEIETLAAREMVADDIGMGPIDIAKRKAANAILEDLRDRRFLKWLFADDPENCPGPIGYVDSAIDIPLQHEIVAKWVDIVWQAQASLHTRPTTTGESGL